jgi:hypothetical protein
MDSACSKRAFEQYRANYCDTSGLVVRASNHHRILHTPSSALLATLAKKTREEMLSDVQPVGEAVSLLRHVKWRLNFMLMSYKLAS